MQGQQKLPPLPETVLVAPGMRFLVKAPEPKSKAGLDITSETKLPVEEWFERKAAVPDREKRMPYWQFRCAFAFKRWGIGHEATEAEFDAAVAEACGQELWSVGRHDLLAENKKKLPEQQKQLEAIATKVAAAKAKLTPAAEPAPVLTPPAPAAQ